MHETAIAGEEKKRKKEERERKRKKTWLLIYFCFRIPKGGVRRAAQRNRVQNLWFVAVRYWLCNFVARHTFSLRDLESRGSLVEKMLAGLWVTGDRSKLLPIKEPLCDSISLISERRKFTTSFDGITMQFNVEYRHLFRIILDDFLIFGKKNNK